MPTEYRTFPGRIVSAITEPSNGRLRVAVDIDAPLRRAREELERCVIEGATVDVVVSEELK